MRYENKFGLPNEVVEWLMKDDYDYEKGVMSATRIMKPVRATVLEQRHYDDLEIDVSELIPAKYGTALHDSFEKVELENCIQEERFYAKVGKHKISGKPDILKFDKDDTSYTLMDLKSTSVWAIVYDEKDEEYRKQLSIYAYILKENGFTIEPVARIIFIFTDWSRSKARQGGNYPPTRVATKDIELWSYEETEKYIKERLELFDNHLNNTEDDDLPDCTRDELWQKDDKWAVMKEGRKTAVKLHDSEEDANKHLSSMDDKHYIEHRPGKVNRCDYCNASQVCNQYVRLKEEGLVEK